MKAVSNKTSANNITHAITDLGSRKNSQGMEIRGQVFIQKREQLARTLSINPSELILWQEQHAYQESLALLGLLHLAITHHLDPLLGEIALWSNSQGSLYPAITIDGWMNIANAHPAFAGIEFEEGPAVEDVGLYALPKFMTCTIYRTDRQIPIRVREYLDEVKGEHPLWKSMPRRMLRHRALQQCARIAFGVSTPELTSHEDDLITQDADLGTPLKAAQQKETRTSLLKMNLSKEIQPIQTSENASISTKDVHAL